MNYIPLTQVCDFQGGSQPPKEQWIDHAEDGYIRMLQIRDFTQPDKDNIEYVRLTKTVKTCNEDDILIGRYGASVGKILTGLSGAYNVAIIKTIPDASKLTKRFLYHYLNSPYFQSFILSVGSRAAQAGFNKEDLSDAQIPQLSLKEQEYVTSRLDKIVDLIALRKQQLSKLDELVKSRFIELFGDRYTNNKKWDNKPLYECADFYNGKAHEQVVDENGEYILVTSRCIASDISDYRRTNALLFPLQVNDIAMVMSDVPNGRALAKCVLIDEDGKYTLNQRICCLRNYSFNPIFFYYLLNRHEYFLSFNDGNAQTNLRKDDLLACNIIIPPMELQEQFAAFVEQTDKSKFEIQKSLEKLETLKKALMQKYFG